MTGGNTMSFARRTIALSILPAVAAMPAFAQGAADAAKIDPADTAWMISATAFVLMMTIPGLALF